MKNKKTAALYLLAFLIVIYLKHYADRAGSDSLLWILRPTTWWTSLLSGHSFTYEQGTGYINHNLRFIIAPACAGLKFWMITSLMLTCSFLHRIEGPKKQLLWLLICFPAALAATIFTNGIRITLSITLPQILQAQENLPPILTPAQLHTAIGTLVYFPSLILLYKLADHLTQNPEKPEPPQTSPNPLWKKYLPALWYLTPVLALPLLSRLAHRDYKNLTRYELPVLTISTIILLLYTLLLLRTPKKVHNNTPHPQPTAK